MSFTNYLRVATVAAVALMAVAAIAQGGGQGGGMMMMRGAGLVGLSQRADVQADIKATDDQKAKLAQLQQAMQDKRRELMQEARESGGGFEGMRESMTKLQESADKQLATILSEDQVKRLREIQIQLEGNRAILRAEVQKALGLREDQKQKIAGIQQKSQEELQALIEEMRGGGGGFDREAMQAEMAKRGNKLSEELGKVLTVDQAAKLKAMGGKEFKATAGIG